MSMQSGFLDPIRYLEYVLTDCENARRSTFVHASPHIQVQCATVLKESTQSCITFYLSDLYIIVYLFLDYVLCPR